MEAFESMQKLDWTPFILIFASRILKSQNFGSKFHIYIPFYIGDRE